MFANVYGYDGVRRAIQLLKNEIIQDGWNLGISSLSDLNPSLVSVVVPFPCIPSIPSTGVPF